MEQATNRLGEITWIEDHDPGDEDDARLPLVTFGDVLRRMARIISPRTTVLVQNSPRAVTAALGSYEGRRQRRRE